MQITDLGQPVVGGGVKTPFEHVSLHDQSSRQGSLDSPLLSRPDVDDETTLGYEAFELVGTDSSDASARPFDQVVGGNAHATASPNR
jgi:hypothetical protein